MNHSFNLTFRLVLFSLLFITKPCQGAINIDSTNTTISTCINNGTATIFASSTNTGASLLYAVSPNFYPLQSSATITSLYPGNYTVRVYDINSPDSTQTNISIFGNYQIPLFTTTSVAPMCGGDTDAKVIAIPTGGLAPYSWEIIAPVQIGPQASEVFSNLATGTYVVRMTDACFNFQTRTVSIANGGTGLSLPMQGTNFYEYFVGCDTVVVALSITLNGGQDTVPLNLHVTSNTGTTVTTINAFSNGGVYTINDTITNVSFGDYLQICVSDSCNHFVCAALDSIPPFRFNLVYQPVVTNCNSQWGAIAYPASDVGFLYPLLLTVKDIALDSIVQAEWFTTYPIIPPLISGRWYSVTITDSCGHQYQENYLWPIGGVPFVGVSTHQGCIDSTAIANFYFSNFGAGVELEILSGPAIVVSTKPRYSYRDTVIYPKLFTNILTNNFTIANMPAGTYSYRATDTCGNIKAGTFTITSVANLFDTLFYKKNCDGTNVLYYNYEVGGAGGSSVLNALTNLGAGNTVYGFPYSHINSLAAGTYVLLVYTYSSANAFFTGSNFCWSVFDTLIIPPYNPYKSSVVVTCNGQIYWQVIADSANSMPPYQYEILSGPQTFPLQNTGLFELQATGTYLARIVDSCANSNTVQVSIDTATLTSIFRLGNLCIGNNIKLTGTSSSFTNYIWQKPDGSIYQGDTLRIPSFTLADTGYYQVQKIVHINGCVDTFFTSYHLAVNDTNSIQNFSICNGQFATLAVTGGTNYLWNTLDTTAAIQVNPTVNTTYTVTVYDSNNCVSIISKFVSVYNQTVNAWANTNLICSTDSAFICASPGFSLYSWSTNETDTCIVAHVAGTYFVTVTDNNGCTAESNSVSITTYATTLVNIFADTTKICAGSTVHICAPTTFTTYLWNTGEIDSCIFTTLAGNYYVTVTDNNGCKAISNHLPVTVLPLPPVSISVNGDTLVAYNAVSYQWYFNENIIPGATSATYIVNASGNYKVAVTDTNGCVATSNTVVIVFAGTSDLADNSRLNIFPNPNSGSFTISFSTEKQREIRIKIWNVIGQLIKQELLQFSNNYTKEIQLDNVSKGIYIIQLNDAIQTVNRKIQIY